MTRTDPPADIGDKAAASWRTTLQHTTTQSTHLICEDLCSQLASANVAEWTLCIQHLRKQRAFELADCVLRAALARFDSEARLHQLQAWLYFERGDHAAALRLFEQLASDDPGNAATALPLARLLVHCGRCGAAAQAIATLFRTAPQSVEVLLQSVELLDGADRKYLAAELCETAIANGTNDARVYTHAGSLSNQLGEFERARQRFGHAIALDSRAFEWFAADGLARAQRYVDNQHPDFALFRDALARISLPARARASLLFAMGKAHDDVGEIESAAMAFRQANAICAGLRVWNRNDWLRLVQTRLRAAPLGKEPAPAPTADWIPVFIVGVPRSGSSLIAARLSQHADTRSRGELPWLQHLARQLREPLDEDASRLRELASIYQMHLLQDDAPTRYYLDKQPLNLLFVDLILHLWPQAKIVYCQRSPRDTALSLWMQDFADAQHGYAFDFDDIAAFIEGCTTLMAHWQRHFPHAIRRIRYEDLIAAPDQHLADLAAWIGIDLKYRTALPKPPGSIATASLWQARQPIYTRALERWRSYLGCIHELERFAE